MIIWRCPPDGIGSCFESSRRLRLAGSSPAISAMTVEISLDIHHVNGDALDNTEKNLLVICPNCHRLEPS